MSEEQKSLFEDGKFEVRPPDCPPLNFTVPSGFCIFCGRPHPTEMDHITPRSKGGKVIRPSCGDCNGPKTDVPIDQWITSQLLMRRRRIRESIFSELSRVKSELKCAFARLPDYDAAHHIIQSAQPFMISGRQYSELRDEVCGLLCLSAFECPNESTRFRHEFTKIRRFIPAYELEFWLVEYLIRTLVQYEVWDRSDGTQEECSFNYWAAWHILYGANPTKYYWAVRDLIDSGITSNVDDELLNGAAAGVIEGYFLQFHYKYGLGNASAFETTTNNQTEHGHFGFVTQRFREGALLVVSKSMNHEWHKMRKEEGELPNG